MKFKCVLSVWIQQQQQQQQRDFIRNCIEIKESCDSFLDFVFTFQILQFNELIWKNDEITRQVLNIDRLFF